MSLVKVTRSVLFNKVVNRNLRDAVKVVNQQKNVFRGFSTCVGNSNGIILKNLYPKHVGVTFINGYSTEKGKIDELFLGIGKNLNQDIVKNVNSVFQFVLSGEEEGKWFLDLKCENGKCGKGDVPQADCTLSMDSKNFLKMFDGKLKPTTAYMTGRLKIKGNLQTALKLEKIMGQLKEKS